MIATSIVSHPERNVIRVQLRQNVVLKEMTEAERSDLDEQLVILDCNKGDVLLHQGVHEMEQYFVLDGVLIRVVTNADAKEMILRFADEHDIAPQLNADHIAFGVVVDRGRNHRRLE